MRLLDKSQASILDSSAIGKAQRPRSFLHLN